MKKKYLIIFGLLLSASILFTTQSTLALGGVDQPNSEPISTNTTEQPVPTTDNSTLNLSLEDALKLMETGNRELKLADSKLQILEKQSQQALARHNAGIAVVDEESRKDRDLNHKRAQWTLDNAKHDRDNQIKALKAQITNEYQNVLSLQQQAENLKLQLANLDTVMNQVNLQIDLGLKIPSDLYTYKAQKSMLEAAQKADMNSINNSMITLKQDLGIDINRNVVLTSSPIPYTKFDESDIDTKIAKAIQNHYDILRYKQDIEITQIEYDIVFYYSGLMTANQVQLSIEDKKATLENLPVTLEVGFRTAYNNLKTIENTIEADKLTVEADQITIKVMERNIEVGNSSSLEMIALQNKLLNDQNTLQQNINAYMTAATNFKNSLDNHLQEQSQ